MDFDYNRFLDAVKRFTVFHELARSYPGLRPGRSMSLYEALIDTVIKQRIALRLALRLYSGIVLRYGERMTLEGEFFYSSPLPERLATASVEELREAGLSRLKARALREIALAEIEGRLPSVEEAVDDPGSTVDELTGLYGVGRWTAELAIAMVHPLFPLGPAGDLAVKRGLSRLTGHKVSEEEVRALTGELGSYAGLIMYLAALLYEGGRGQASSQAFS